MLIVLRNVRLAFPELYTTKPFGGTGKSRCSAILLMDPGTPHGTANVQLVQKAIIEVATEKWKDKARQMVQALSSKAELCLHDGNEKSEYEGFPGMFFASSSSDLPPVVVDENKRVLTAQSHQNKLYSGCYVNAQIDVWAQDNQFGKKVNAKLIAVQFHGQGQAFSGGASYDDNLFTAADPSAGATGSDFFGAGNPFAPTTRAAPANGFDPFAAPANGFDPFAAPATADSFFAATPPAQQLPW